MSSNTILIPSLKEADLDKSIQEAVKKKKKKKKK